MYFCFGNTHFIPWLFDNLVLPVHHLYDLVFSRVVRCILLIGRGSKSVILVHSYNVYSSYSDQVLSPNISPKITQMRSPTTKLRLTPHNVCLWRPCGRLTTLDHDRQYCTRGLELGWRIRDTRYLWQSAQYVVPSIGSNNCVFSHICLWRSLVTVIGSRSQSEDFNTNVSTLFLRCFAVAWVQEIRLNLKFWQRGANAQLAVAIQNH